MKLLFHISLLVLLFSSVALADTHLIATDGTDTGDCTGAACKTFAYVQAAAVAGDTIELAAGTYNADEGGLTVTKSGTSGNPITFQCETDTMTGASPCIVDGDYLRTPFEIDNKNYITVIGIHFKESDSSGLGVIDIDIADNLIFQRVTASDAYNPENNQQVWRITLVTNSLFEDCAAWGNGRNSALLKLSDDNVLRRFWMMFHDKQSVHGAGCTQMYNSDSNIYENVLCSYDGSGTWPSAPRYLSGIIGRDDGSESYNNAVYGSVVWDLNAIDGDNSSGNFFAPSDVGSAVGNSFTDCVGINNYHGLLWNNQDGFTVDRMTLISTNSHSVGVILNDPRNNTSKDDIDFKNSIVMGFDCGWEYDRNPDSGTQSHTYNTFYNNGTDFCDGGPADGTENTTNPTFDTSTYGYGAYLMQPSALDGLGEGAGNIGAEVLYRYEDGVLSAVELWPWPMEGRILAESGFSVTYSENQGSSETGGLWKTLDGVYLNVHTVSPVDGGTGVSITATATWDYGPSVNNVDVYLDDAGDLCSASDCDGDTNLVSDDDADKEYDMSTLTVDTIYCLSITSNSGDGDCQEFQFTTTGGPPQLPATKSSIAIDDGAGDVVIDDGGIAIK